MKLLQEDERLHVIAEPRKLMKMSLSQLMREEVAAATESTSTPRNMLVASQRKRLEMKQDPIISASSMTSDVLDPDYAENQRRKTQSALPASAHPKEAAKVWMDKLRKINAKPVCPDVEFVQKGSYTVQYSTTTNKQEINHPRHHPPRTTPPHPPS